MKFFASALSLLLLASSVSAHGFVPKIVVDGKTFAGNVPQGASKKSAIRQVSSISPVKGASNRAINCGPNAKAATGVADAMPGSKVAFHWVASAKPKQNWPHNTGPMLTYMASCGSKSCSEFDAINAQWFKIHQVGRKSNGKWAQEDLMSGAPAIVTLPSNLKAGNYLIRHEIIGLHLASSKGGAEFYPSCAQLRVGGNKAGVPEAKDLVKFPGAYKDTNPGIFGNGFFNAKAKYQFPGPAIAKLVSGSTTNKKVISLDTREPSTVVVAPSHKRAKRAAHSLPLPVA